MDNNILEIDDNHNTQQYLSFRLAGEEYGIDILSVQEIRGFEKATMIPNTPDYLLGVMNLRGSVVPIVDLRIRFNLASESTETTVTILVNVATERGTRTIGIVVDAVSDVHTINIDSISDTPELASNIAKNFVTGLATMESNMIILLDIELLISEGILDYEEDPSELNLAQVVGE